ncbi:MAG: type II secretion system protein [Phycisphaerales bacterium]|nr:MAG: type II secretion system protein [Phycisphaerales bacterium]
MPPIRKAFTIVELLVVIGIIALLISLVIVSLRGVKLAANRVDSLNSLRGIVLAYNSYSTDHRSTLMPGFLDEAALNNLYVGAELEDGIALNQCGGGLCDASSYVWRLAPYMGHQWQTVMTDYHSAEVTAYFLNREFSTDGSGIYGFGSATWPTQLGIGAVPSFGLNSIFVGGDSYHGGPTAVSRNPWMPTDPNDVLAATNYTEVKNPAKLIVFGSTRYYADQSTFYDYDNDTAPVNDPIMGYCELRPPFIPLGPDTWERHWHLEGALAVDDGGSMYSNGGGVPVGRWGDDDFLSAMLDGSTAVEDLTALGAPAGFDHNYAPNAAAMQKIMSRWSPFVTAPFE